MPVSTGPALPRRQLGRHLRTLRKEAGYTIARTAVAVELSVATVNRIEAGQTSLKTRDVRAFCALYEAAPETAAFLVTLAGETRTRGWWQAYQDVTNAEFSFYLGLEGAAKESLTYESELVPGLLQTEAYSQAVILTHLPGVDEDGVARRVALRTRRQQILTKRKPPIGLRAVLSETVLRRQLGTPGVMAAQLTKILKYTQLPNVAIRVMPFTGGLHIGAISGSFALLRFPLSRDGTSEPPIVCVDDLLGASYITDEQLTAPYLAAHNGLWGAALKETTSARLISDVLKEWK